ncbi:hypothetical protein [Kribbella sindirgiensis]|uniref:Uncharacterized protein n=1 Tax=Kribbella sindirgiensis TaxID=1124744 RepID=A0A4R0IN84_9ACTN|nr:hypothetical protein [Kribbella sindirgiensis]TCC35083.1 hypothetical protein E0H50_14540 [Kribbella sindirgiensis]
MELDPVLELYGLPPEEFTAARNELARVLQVAGDVRSSASVKALRKPTIAAWLANRLVRIAPDMIAELTEFGSDLRDAHQSGDRVTLQRLTPRRHEIVDRLVEVAKADVADGRVVTATTAERLAATLDAALVDPGAAQLLRTGRLTTGLRHVGFGVVDEAGVPLPVVGAVPKRPLAQAARSAATARKAAVTRKPTADRTRKSAAEELRRRQRAEVQERLQHIEADYEVAEKERLDAESELDANEHHIADMRTAIERLSDELERARRELRQAQSRTRQLERALTRAGRNAAAARRRLDAQQQRLEALSD